MKELKRQIIRGIHFKTLAFPRTDPKNLLEIDLDHGTIGFALYTIDLERAKCSGWRILRPENLLNSIILDVEEPIYDECETTYDLHIEKGCWISKNICKFSPSSNKDLEPSLYRKKWTYIITTQRGKASISYTTLCARPMMGTVGIIHFPNLESKDYYQYLEGEKIECKARINR